MKESAENDGDSGKSDSFNGRLIFGERLFSG